MAGTADRLPDSAKWVHCVRAWSCAAGQIDARV